MRKYISTFIFSLLMVKAFAQNENPLHWWRATLLRKDGHTIVFNFEWKQEKEKPVWYIRNAKERIQVTDIQISGDSVIARMPVFESQFRLKKKDNNLEGVWIKGGAVNPQVISCNIQPGRQRFVVSGLSKKNISGRWAVSFKQSDSTDLSVGEFKQTDRLVTGTFLNPTGDYRYLEGAIKNDSLLLSAFDGGHAFLFTAKIENNNTLSGGWFYSGASHKEEWKAVRNAKAIVTEESVAMFLKPGEEKLNFSFDDLDGHPVSIRDDRFKDKVVVVQLMGSWCPNCMDETAFLSDYYNKNKQRGVEIISLAYEYSADRERSVKSIRKFQQRFNVQYPMLITGVTVNDSMRTEKTLPQLTPIKFFPSSVILDKKGKVRKLDTGFNGPATGEHYLKFKKEFEATIDKLLNEK